MLNDFSSGVACSRAACFVTFSPRLPTAPLAVHNRPFCGSCSGSGTGVSIASFEFVVSCPKFGSAIALSAVLICFLNDPSRVPDKPPATCFATCYMLCYAMKNPPTAPLAVQSRQCCGSGCRCSGWDRGPLWDVGTGVSVAQCSLVGLPEGSGLHPLPTGRETAFWFILAPSPTASH